MINGNQHLRTSEAIGNEPPLVTIGLPVYNGGADLEEALESLVAQDYPNIELLISDNASTDGTTVRLCRRFAEQFSHVRYLRHANNMGAAANFAWVAQQAKGDYFLWAAHDDRWSPNFVTALVEALEAAPTAVLATPHTRYRKIKGDQVSIEEIPPLQAGRRLERARQFLQTDRCVWIYGLYRTAWIRQHVGRLAEYPSVTADLIWLFRTFLHHGATGAPQAIYYRTTRARRDPLRTQKSRVLLWSWIRRQMHELVDEAAADEELVELHRLVDRFYFQAHIARGNPIGTGVRWIKVAVLLRWYRWFDRSSGGNSTARPIYFRSSYDAPPRSADDTSSRRVA